jgi:ATP-dependent protease HslVU (ClpYQ) peptidase subunit
MTCVVAIVDKSGSIYMGADSAASTPHTIRASKVPKVFKKGPLLLGGCGSFRMIQLLQYALSVKLPPAITPRSVEHYLCTEFVDTVRSTYTEYGLLHDTDKDFDRGQVLIGVKGGGLYCMDYDFQINSFAEEYDSIGSGSEYALGALAATPRLKTGKRVELALSAAAQFDPGVRGPFLLEILERS